MSIFNAELFVNLFSNFQVHCSSLSRGHEKENNMAKKKNARELLVMSQAIVDLLNSPREDMNNIGTEFVGIARKIPPAKTWNVTYSKAKKMGFTSEIAEIYATACRNAAIIRSAFPVFSKKSLEGKSKI